MQWFTLAFVTLAVCAMSSARTIPNGMMFYQSAPVYYKRSVPIHRMMYVHYLPQHASRRSANAGGVSAFAAGDTIATGTYLRECNHQAEGQYVNQQKAAVEYQPEVPLDPVGDGGATSIAEAYPEQNYASDQLDTEEPSYETDPLKISIDQPEQQAEPEPETPQPTVFYSDVTEPAPEVLSVKKEKSPKQYSPEVIPEQDPTGAVFSAEESPAVNDIGQSSAELPAEAPEAIPTQRPLVLRRKPVKAYIPPKKKIRVELEAPESVEYEDDEESYYVPQVPQYHHRKQNKAAAPTRKPASHPAGTYFPIDFGGTSGGTIAIANSFSTGEGGSATSTATAYGSPAVARSKAAKAAAKKRLALAHE